MLVSLFFFQLFVVVSIGPPSFSIHRCPLSMCIHTKLFFLIDLMETEIGLLTNSLAQKYLPYISNHPESKIVPRKLNYSEMYKDDMAEFKLSTPHHLSFSSSSKPKKKFKTVLVLWLRYSLQKISPYATLEAARDIRDS